MSRKHSEIKIIDRIRVKGHKDFLNDPDGQEIKVLGWRASINFYTFSLCISS